MYTRASVRARWPLSNTPHYVCIDRPRRQKQLTNYLSPYRTLESNELKSNYTFKNLLARKLYKILTYIKYFSRSHCNQILNILFCFRIHSSTIKVLLKRAVESSTMCGWLWLQFFKPMRVGCGRAQCSSGMKRPAARIVVVFCSFSPYQIENSA